MSAQSLAMATELPTMPVVNSTTSVSATTMSAVRRMRRFRTRSRACSRYSTRPAESGSSDTGGGRAVFSHTLLSLRAMTVLPKGRFPSGSIGRVCVIL